MKLQFFTLINVKENQFLIKIYSKHIEIISYYPIFQLIVKI